MPSFQRKAEYSGDLASDYQSLAYSKVLLELISFIYH